MATFPYCNLGHYHHVLGLRTQLWRLRCCSCCSWYRGGRSTTWNGTLACFFTHFDIDLKLLAKVYYLSTFYRRTDLALRIGLFYTAASLSGAFGGVFRLYTYTFYGKKLTDLTGLLARGLAEIGPRGGLEGWRWILIIEGLLASLSFPKIRRVSNICVRIQTVVCGFLSYIILPRSLETAPFLTSEEKDFARLRISLDSPSVSAR